MDIKVDRLMVHATIFALRAGRKLGVNDKGLLEDWEEKLEEDRALKQKESQR